MSDSPFRMLATDYDGTIATGGRITNKVETALLQAKENDFLISIVTGRGFDDLLRVCPQVKVFDLIVAENGSILYFPPQEKIEFLASYPPIEFIAQLMSHSIPFYQNRIMATVRRKFVEKVNALIDEFKFPLHIICHKDYGLILPLGMNKAKGLEKALLHFDITKNQVIAVGDAENDLDFLDFCGFKVAVGNAEETVKAKADWIATKEEGEGMIEFIQNYLLA
ncbi:MAG: HAD family hydrolase [Cyanobacteria bacterium P01_A01_bin.84]